MASYQIYITSNTSVQLLMCIARNSIQLPQTYSTQPKQPTCILEVNSRDSSYWEAATKCQHLQWEVDTLHIHRCLFANEAATQTHIHAHTPLHINRQTHAKIVKHYRTLATQTQKNNL